MILVLRTALFVLLVALALLAAVFTPGMPDEFLAIAAAEEVAEGES